MSSCGPGSQAELPLPSPSYGLQGGVQSALHAESAMPTETFEAAGPEAAPRRPGSPAAAACRPRSPSRPAPPRPRRSPPHPVLDAVALHLVPELQHVPHGPLREAQVLLRVGGLDAEERIVGVRQHHVPVVVLGALACAARERQDRQAWLPLGTVGAGQEELARRCAFPGRQGGAPQLAS